MARRNEDKVLGTLGELILMQWQEIESAIMADAELKARIAQETEDFEQKALAIAMMIVESDAEIMKNTNYEARRFAAHRVFSYAINLYIKDFSTQKQWGFLHWFFQQVSTPRFRKIVHDALIDLLRTRNSLLHSKYERINSVRRYCALYINPYWNPNNNNTVGEIHDETQEYFKDTTFVPPIFSGKAKKLFDVSLSKGELDKLLFEYYTRKSVANKSLWNGKRNKL